MSSARFGTIPGRMARPTKIVQLGLEAEMLACRQQGLTLDAAVDRLNAKLVRDGVDATVSRSAVARYLGSLDAATVAVAHQPQYAAQNADLCIAVGERVRRNLWRLDALMADADAQGDGDPRELLAAMREERETLKFWVDAADRVYNVQRVAAFQEEVVSVIAEADPATAVRIRDALNARQSLRLAALASG